MKLTDGDAIVQTSFESRLDLDLLVVGMNVDICAAKSVLSNISTFLDLTVDMLTDHNMMRMLSERSIDVSGSLRFCR